MPGDQILGTLNDRAVLVSSLARLLDRFSLWCLTLLRAGSELLVSRTNVLRRGAYVGTLSHHVEHCVVATYSLSVVPELRVGRFRGSSMKLWITVMLR